MIGDVWNFHFRNIGFVLNIKKTTMFESGNHPGPVAPSGAAGGLLSATTNTPRSFRRDPQRTATKEEKTIQT